MLAWKASEVIQRKCDTVFQMVYYMVHDGNKKKPLHVSTAQAIHETCRSKVLITSLNHLGIAVSYDTVERQDHQLATRIITLAEGHLIPIPPIIIKGKPLRAAMDNFDKEEDSPSGIGGTHDTVLFLFQDSSEEFSDNRSDIDYATINTRKRTFGETLTCQNLVPFMKPKVRGTIATEYINSCEITK